MIVLAASKRTNMYSLEKEAGCGALDGVQRCDKSPWAGSPFHLALRNCPQHPQNCTEHFLCRSLL